MCASTASVRLTCNPVVAHTGAPQRCSYAALRNASVSYSHARATPHCMRCSHAYERACCRATLPLVDRGSALNLCPAAGWRGQAPQAGAFPPKNHYSPTNWSHTTYYVLGIYVSGDRVVAERWSNQGWFPLLSVLIVVVAIGNTTRRQRHFVVVGTPLMRHDKGWDKAFGRRRAAISRLCRSVSQLRGAVH
jgi:hypothetical protein